MVAITTCVTQQKLTLTVKAFNWFVTVNCIVTGRGGAAAVMLNCARAEIATQKYLPQALELSLAYHIVTVPGAQLRKHLSCSLRLSLSE